MPLYEHQCRNCTLNWLEEYSLEYFDLMKKKNRTLPCPDCDSYDTYRCVSAVPTHFKGAGWSAQGYYKYEPYDQHKAEGKDVKLYDRKEDILRDMRGERALAAKRRLKREDELAKRFLGPDYAMTQAKADERIKKEVDKVKI